MVRTIFFVMLLAAGPMLIAQDNDSTSTRAERGMRNPEAEMAMPEVELGPLLNERQLERKKWYYSIEEAMRSPADVYKLSLRGQDLKFFPLEVTRFQNLQVLNLSDNKIKVVPPAIAELPHLQVLILADNKIKFLPQEMRDLDNLTQLYLAGNKLVTVPAWVGGLAKLRRLDLTFNRLTQYEIEQLQSRLPRCEVTH